jgi:broad specificity phosphatase PhoE
MFGVKSLAYHPDNKNYHRKKKRFFKRYTKFQHPHQNIPNYDLRLIILRHAERVDLALGPQWYDQVFGGVPSASPQSYQNPILPQRLPHRANTLLYVFDPPITRTGEQESVRRGQQLSRLGVNVDYCYSSPASRSVLTANGVLRGMNKSQVSICLEPYLFEPMNWNTQLQMLGDMSPFMSTGDWANSGYNINRRYPRLDDYLNPSETETDYYTRSQYVFNSLEDRHSYNRQQFGNRRRPTTILIVGHAGTPIIFPTVALQQTFNAQVFGEQCGHIPFLHTVVLERNAANHKWYTRPIVPPFV